MVYSTEASKWRAYQFSDPFAAGSFYVCNKISTRFCRPDCDAHPITELHSEIKFVDAAADAVHLGFSPCGSCDPMSVPSVDVNLLLVTVREINAMIGFVPPLLDDDEDKVTETIKENIIGHNVQRRMSVPTTFSSKNTMKPASYAVSKNDSEHYRLIDLACRHLALAAALSIFASSSSSSPKEESSKKKGGRKRRGGVLGFKELATKSKLSAWHFHRVFKSIIGLTPKTYGDMCWEFLEKEKEAMDAGEPTQARTRSPRTKTAQSTKAKTPKSAVSSSTATPVIKEEPFHFDLQEPYTTPPQSALSAPGSGQKRARVEENMPSPKRVHASPQLSPFSNLRLDESDTAANLGARAISVPDLNTFGAPNTLFTHSHNFDYFKDDMPSTDAVLASLRQDPLSIPEDYNYGVPNDMPQELSEMSHGISPATADEISPLNGTMLSPEMMAEMQFPNSQGFALAVDPINEDEIFPNMDLFPDLFRKNEYPTDYNMHDPLLPGLAPELMTNMEF